MVLCNKKIKLKGGKNMDKSLVFFFLALLVLWLVLSEVYGDKYISKFISKLLEGEANE